MSATIENKFPLLEEKQALEQPTFKEQPPTFKEQPQRVDMLNYPHKQPQFNFNLTH